eukprot:gene12470-1079_t
MEAGEEGEALAPLGLGLAGCRAEMGLRAAPVGGDAVAGRRRSGHVRPFARGEARVDR